MSDNPRSVSYTLGNTEAEHQRLARQALLFNPLTERLFEAAGIGPGQRVLDLGSGAGDVSILLAGMVGPTGAVVGVERNEETIAWARERVEKAGHGNVTFFHGDVAEIRDHEPFDAAVGRWILMFVPDPVAVVRAASALVRRGGVVAFHEVSWEACLGKSAPLRLTREAVRLLLSAFAQTGANTEMGYALPSVFEAAGLPRPRVHMETLLGAESTFGEWVAMTLRSVSPYVDETALTAVGDLSTLPVRMLEEMTDAGTVIAWPSMIGAWSTKTRSPAQR